jgi:hypothetical protein
MTQNYFQRSGFGLWTKTSSSANRATPVRCLARRLAENPDVSVLLLEAGGSDDVPSVLEAQSMARQSWKRSGLAFQARLNRIRLARSHISHSDKFCG